MTGQQEDDERHERIVWISLDEQKESMTAPSTNTKLEGNLIIPKAAEGIVVFAHGSGSSRHSPRNQYVAQVLNNAGLATLLTDLLTKEEEEVDIKTRQHRFNIDLLSKRLVAVTDWITQNPDTQKLFVGYFGASTGAAAALASAAERGNIISAIVSRGGRPDLAGSKALKNVQAPTLFIVGEKDVQVIGMNENAMKQLDQVERKKLKIVPGATHLFEEPGTLEEVARLARGWFQCYFLIKKHNHK
ncbi:MAG TPA: alpha/beta hydrolase [Nitrososphaeraceae archaeon]|nr:alpha/beta hydrolase [Nitrososphaeraceae archaeon]